ncbi:sensor histidine kinase [Armatimonas rosea]|uniref:histidine kinase n=1 Tax=Armatimonas rosea TaxID=685828 RepID=A0A7W9W9P7_ARMRO|nr:response regulator [Armatimonas rosea]MBB6053521.1 two-component sensor histidine kinase [Armatimonas rosea]
MRAYQLLHVEDDPLDAELVRACLEDAAPNFTVTTVSRQESYVAALQANPPDLVISDFNLTAFNGIQAFQLLQDTDSTIPFILLSGALGESRAVECLKLGMTDYILKDQLERLPPAVERALREAHERRERLAAEETLRERQKEIEDLNQRLQRAIMESHHRIKNNLQVLIALVDAMRFDDDSGTQALARLARHIRGLATLHDLLTHQTSTPGVPLDSVSARFALERLIPAMANVLTPRVITLDADEVELSLKQVSSLSLLVNELVSNAIKHGDGTIHISLKQEAAEIQLDVYNEGPGFPPSFDPIRSASIGLSLIESIGTWDLAGTLTFVNTPTGARVGLRFPSSEAP